MNDATVSKIVLLKFPNDATSAKAPDHLQGFVFHHAVHLLLPGEVFGGEILYTPHGEDIETSGSVQVRLLRPTQTEGTGSEQDTIMRLEWDGIIARARPDLSELIFAEHFLRAAPGLEQWRNVKN